MKTGPLLGMGTYFLLDSNTPIGTEVLFNKPRVKALYRISYDKLFNVRKKQNIINIPTNDKTLFTSNKTPNLKTNQTHTQHLCRTKFSSDLLTHNKAIITSSIEQFFSTQLINNACLQNYQRYVNNHGVEFATA